MPAMNAPRAMASPSQCATDADSSATTSTASTKISSDLVLLISVNSGGSTHLPMITTARKYSSALMPVMPSAVHSWSELPWAAVDISASMMMAAMSWNSRMPMATWPWAVVISLRWLSSLLTMAVDDSAIADAPTSMAVSDCSLYR